MMKNLFILFADYRSLHIFDKCFDNKSSFDLALECAKNAGDEVCVFALDENSEYQSEFLKELKSNCVENVKIECITQNSVSCLFEKMYDVSKNDDFKNILFSYADLPFLNIALIEEILDTHKKYLAEYTFADGFPYGFSCEVLDIGTVNILKELSKTTFENAGKSKITRSCIFDFIKNDINSFEIETVLCDEDFRLLRFSFDTSNLQNKNSCVSLFEKLLLASDDEKKSALQVSKIASECLGSYKSVPYYYNVQITDKSTSKCLYVPEIMHSPKNNNFMSKQDFCSLVKKIYDFSENAIINLSAFGEPLYHPDFIDFVEIVLSYPTLSCVIETDGFLITQEFAQRIKKVFDNAPCRRGFNEYFDKILWIVKVDAVSSENYRKIYGEGDLKKALDAVEILQKYFPGNVYSQFTRLCQNEEDLEQFYRYWSDKNSPSGGNFIIQKYSSFCGVLPDYKPADLSPLERNACYHLRRDMTILFNGDVPLCRECLLSCMIGNINSMNFNTICQKIEDELKCHLDQKYCEKCKECDEYYTYNF